MAAFRRWKEQRLARADESRKGSVDEAIAGLVQFLNGQERFCTTSSCAGRLLLAQAPARGFNGYEVQKKNCSWLMVTHQLCAKEDVHSVAIDSGFRNSGITVGRRGKIMMAVRSTHCLEVPLSHMGKLMVTEEYVEFLVQIANQKMEENMKRIDRFYNCLQLALKTELSMSNSPRETMQKTHSVYTHRRKRKPNKEPGVCTSSENKEESEIEDDPEANLSIFS
ncbi:tRNA wybutosine-synthesizing protein 3 homolog isoform X2 [Chelonoidis abingdonii]|uniref:tRNA wybutosine-synthesizing protein 3 homolog isoform X2 n=1 Tax=Chelonoidis abingdonii TaxID=106734 RepID=UPI0013F2188B|nr:tRNA wybutosine-synthesizing protein 3 homolog isoform X2 [Chelonoidis abingdonii]